MYEDEHQTNPSFSCFKCLLKRLALNVWAAVQPGEISGASVLYRHQIILGNKSASRYTALQEKSTTFWMKTDSGNENECSIVDSRAAAQQD